MNLTLFSLILCVFCIASIQGLDNGLGRTPPMGWNSWNKFNCNIDEKLIRETADALVSSGLAAKGYKYVNLDDCWQVARDSEGYILPDPNKFPSGMKALADYVHSKGLLFGLYSDSGYYTCQKRPGSLGSELKDAQKYAEWGVDFLKYDNCYDDGTSPKLRYPPMRDALNKTGKPIFFSMCEWGVENPASWATEVGNSWRTTGDISDNWDSFVSILDQQVGLEKYAGPGHWNDPDMLEVGNGGMTPSEYEAHFALWALLKAPLLIGCDLTKMDSHTLNLLSNEEIIALNQDKLGIQGKRVLKKGDQEIWAVPLEGGDVGAVLFNRGKNEVEITADFFMIGFKGDEGLVRDLLQKKDIGKMKDKYVSKVQGHSVKVIRVRHA